MYRKKSAADLTALFGNAGRTPYLYRPVYNLKSEEDRALAAAVIELAIERLPRWVYGLGELSVRIDTAGLTEAFSRSAQNLKNHQLTKEQVKKILSRTELGWLATEAKRTVAKVITDLQWILPLVQAELHDLATARHLTIDEMKENKGKLTPKALEAAGESLNSVRNDILGVTP